MIKKVFNRIDLILILILAFAIYIRFSGLMLNIYDPFERYSHHFNVELFLNKLQPSVFMHPTLYPNIVALIYLLTYAAGRLFGTFSDITDWVSYYLQHMTTFLLAGRLVSAAASAATVYLCYAAGRRLKDRNTGLVAAAVMAMINSQSELAPRVFVNPTAVFFAIAAYFAILLMQEKGTIKRKVSAGAMCGLAISADYPLGLLLIPLSVAHLLPGKPTPWIRRVGNLLAAWFSAAAALFATSPHILIHYKDFISDFFHQASLSSAGYYSTAATEKIPWIYLTWMLDNYNFGIIMGALAAAGILLLVLSRPRVNLVFLSFPVFLVLFFSLATHKSVRFIFPAFPFLAIAAGYTAAWIMEKDFLKKYPLKIFLPLAVILLLFTVQNEIVNFFIKPIDKSLPAVELRDWIFKNIPSGSIIVHEQGLPDDLPQMPPAGENRKSGQENPLFQIVLEKGKKYYKSVTPQIETRAHRLMLKGRKKYYQSNPDKKFFHLYELPDYNVECGFIYSPDLMQLIGTDYIVVSDIFYNIFRESPERFPQINAFYDWLEDESAMMQKFPRDGDNPQYFPLRIFRLIPPSEPVSSIAERFLQNLDRFTCVSPDELSMVSDLLKTIPDISLRQQLVTYAADYTLKPPPDSWGQELDDALKEKYTPLSGYTLKKILYNKEPSYAELHYIRSEDNKIFAVRIEPLSKKNAFAKTGKYNISYITLEGTSFGKNEERLLNDLAAFLKKIENPQK
ncbi:MAG: glycosyltransferase family 39 protein [bacterium]